VPWQSQPLYGQSVICKVREVPSFSTKVISGMFFSKVCLSSRNQLQGQGLKSP